MKKIIYLSFAMLVLTSQAESKFWIGCNIGTDINKITGTLDDGLRISKIQPTIISELQLDADFQINEKWFLGGVLSFGLPIAKKKIDDTFQPSTHGIHLKHRFIFLVKPYLEYKFNNRWSIYGIAGFSRSYFELKNNKDTTYENYDTFRFTPGIGARNYISDTMSISAELLYSKKKRIHDTATQQGMMSIKTNQQSFSAKLCFRVAL